ncbi:MAG: GatB/YqeY domain-containing protein [Candidatus Scalindua sp. AMX11]|nr:MAG: GatB/YqeY domain-containing protein [Candidatus Scalindua sp.]NOG85577.1 GatB/YqeY domain-containing protein [Planctomycetota bacterium]RZV90175.1 MAG: GatB/YqeY domain-containing protein [Candidatus Scalindua sp. SCAELEC01]TDE64956.1 MAG: GatB/YqeY domain-containing protein [Candidatus Scalindua sp. AMX11]GJQ59607.1 MAG: aspartyl-tRNA amidotransferase subunit B [Candidatus Scalindua sp.]
MKERITEELKVAMKARDTTRVSVLRMLLAEMTHLEKSGEEFVYQDVVKGYAKKLRKAIEEYKRLDVPDRVEANVAELAIVDEFLPKQLSDDELEKIVREVVTSENYTSKDIGLAMRTIMGKYKDVADGKKVQSLLKGILAS